MRVNSQHNALQQLHARRGAHLQRGRLLRRRVLRDPPQRLGRALLHVVLHKGVWYAREQQLGDDKARRGRVGVCVVGEQ
jgi:hypothetical protein